MVQRPPQLLVLVEVYYRPERELVHSNQDYRNYEQSDYGNDRVGWGKTATASWTFDRDNAGYAGQFIWTGTDYIGEPTPWHNQNHTPVKSFLFWYCRYCWYSKK